MDRLRGFLTVRKKGTTVNHVVAWSTDCALFQLRQPDSMHLHSVPAASQREHNFLNVSDPAGRTPSPVLLKEPKIPLHDSRLAITGTCDRHTTSADGRNVEVNVVGGPRSRQRLLKKDRQTMSSLGAWWLCV